MNVYKFSGKRGDQTVQGEKKALSEEAVRSELSEDGIIDLEVHDLGMVQCWIESEGVYRKSEYSHVADLDPNCGWFAVYPTTEGPKVDMHLLKADFNLAKPFIQSLINNASGPHQSEGGSVIALPFPMGAFASMMQNRNDNNSSQPDAVSIFISAYIGFFQSKMKLSKANSKLARKIITRLFEEALKVLATKNVPQPSKEGTLNANIG